MFSKPVDAARARIVPPGLNHGALTGKLLSRMNQGRADISLGSSLLWETEQKDQQEKAICFHDVILMTSKQHTQSNTPTSNVQLCNIQVQKKKKRIKFPVLLLSKNFFFLERKGKAICSFSHEKE